MQLRNARLTILAGVMVAMSVVGGRCMAAPHDRNSPVVQESANGNGAPSPHASQMQVSGTTNNFTISAQHADLLSLLKLVFDQAHRQFVPDATVQGDVTFALSGQRFDTVLASICKQAFLRYELDKNGVYQIRPDDEALRTFILKRRAINFVLQDQLRSLGYTVPSIGAGNNTGTGGFGGGGAAGGRAAGPGSQSPNSVTQGVFGRSQQSPINDQTSASRDQNTANGIQQQQKGGLLSPSAMKRSAATAKGALGAQAPQGPQGGAGPSAENRGRVPVQLDANLKEAESQDNPTRGLASGLGMPEALSLENEAQYQVFLRQNRLVTINTKGEGVSVRDVLQDLSRQSGVPIWIDPGVPSGKEFVVNASIPPRFLNEVLNLLASQAHLEWRWLNNHILITTTPQLLFYLRGTQLPTLGGITVLPQRSFLQQNNAPAADQKAKADDKKTDDQAKKEKPTGN